MTHENKVGKNSEETKQTPPQQGKKSQKARKRKQNGEEANGKSFISGVRLSSEAVFLVSFTLFHQLGTKV